MLRVVIICIICSVFWVMIFFNLWCIISDMCFVSRNCWFWKCIFFNFGEGVYSWMSLVFFKLVFCWEIRWWVLIRLLYCNFFFSVLFFSWSIKFWNIFIGLFWYLFLFCWFLVLFIIIFLFFGVMFFLFYRFSFKMVFRV